MLESWCSFVKDLVHEAHLKVRHRYERVYCRVPSWGKLSHCSFSPRARQLSPWPKTRRFTTGLPTPARDIQ
jgi:hypothetical protein